LIFGNVPDLFGEPVEVSGQVTKSVEKTRNRVKAADKTKTKKSAAPEQNAPKTKPVVPVPPEAEILMAVASLYSDRLRPFGRILRKRLAERTEKSDAQECDLIQLRRACEDSNNLRLTSEEGGEWSAILLDQVEDFIDVYDKQDDYPDELWSAAEGYFRSLPEHEAVLPGGRYACAQTLASRHLDFLQGYSLGHICHFVQLAISTKKILGYLNGGITCYQFSHSCTKDQAAAQQSSCAQVTAELQVANWDVARGCLRDIMNDALNNQANQVPLSNIKRIFRSQFEIELSETALGHSKLSELLQDERLNDICTVRLLEQGYFVIPMFEICDSQSDGQGTESTAFSWADVEDDEVQTTDSDDEVTGFCGTPCWLDEADQEKGIGLSLNVHVEPVGEPESIACSPCVHINVVHHNTFLHAATSPLVKATRQRSQSLPRCIGRTRLESPCLNLASPAEPMPPTPEFCAPLTPEMWVGLASACDSGLQSVPESQAVDKFSWSTSGLDAVVHVPPEPFLEQFNLSEQFQFVIENSLMSSMPPMCWSIEQAMCELDQGKVSAMQISLADHV
jgi:hypothetical protein